MSNKLYVGNLSFQTAESDLETKFGEFGTVTSVKIVKEFDTGRSKGFGFVEMETSQAAEECISNLDGKDFGGRDIKVNIAKERTQERSSNRW